MDIEQIKAYAMHELELWQQTEFGEARDIWMLRHHQLLLVASIAESLQGLNMAPFRTRLEGLEQRLSALEPDPFLPELDAEERIVALEAECNRLQNALDKEVISLSRRINDLAGYHN